MKNISEAKKSELIRREEKLNKLSSNLENKRTILNSDIKEWDKIVDVRVAKLKREQDKFDTDFRSRTKQLDDEQKRLDLRSLSLPKEREALKKLVAENKAGIEKNKKTLIVMNDSIRDNRVKKENLDRIEASLEERDKESAKHSEALVKKENIVIKQKEIITADKEANAKEVERLREKEGHIENQYHDALTLKSKCTQQSSKNSAESKRLGRLESQLNSREGSLRREQSALNSERANLKREAQSVRTKDALADQKREETNGKLKEYFKIKREVAIERVKLEAFQKSLKKREAEVKEALRAVKAGKATIVKEKERLSEWQKELKTLEADVNDLLKLSGVEKREIDKKRRVLKKLRQAKKED